jgi:DNA repair exonuclease SbcCD nuclease subunit
MKFIHAADIHLDSPLVGLSAYQDAPAELLRHATRNAFENLISEAVAEEVDFVVIAGDLYDGPWRDFNTGLFFARQMGRLNAVNIPVYLLMGNHDAESEMTKRLVLPSNVFKFDAKKPQTFKIDHLRVALHGRSFKDAATTENLAVTYPAPVEGWLNIGVLHTALEGNTVHANYAPCSVAELQARGYQYWALGHVHEHRIIPGDCTIAFPGNLQGRHIREPGPRGALMVQASGVDITSVDRFFVDVLRWHSLAVDVSQAATMTEAVAAVGHSLEKLLRGAEADKPLAVRVTLSGACHAHAELFGLEVQLREEVKAQAFSLGSDRLWIEKVRLETTPVDTEDTVSLRGDAVAELQTLLADAPKDAALLTSMHEELMVLIGKLPLDVLAAIPALEDVRAGRLQNLVSATTPSLIAQVAKAA